MKLYPALLFAFMLLAGPAWAVTGTCVNGTNSGKECTCDNGEAVDYPCTNSTGATLCGTGFTCAEADWAGSGAESSETSFIISSDVPLTCGTQVDGCIGAEDPDPTEDPDFINACDTDTCRLSGDTCTDNDDCKYCAAGLDSTGNLKICTAHADCGTGGRAVISGSAFEYCDNDNLRQVIQPRKLINLMDTLATTNIGGSAYKTIPLNQSVPFTPDSAFYRVGVDGGGASDDFDNTIQIVKNGVYELSGQISLDDTRMSVKGSRDVVAMRIERCRCSNGLVTACAVCEEDDAVATSTKCDDDDAGDDDRNDDHEDGSDAGNASEPGLWCVLDGGKAASYASKKIFVSWTVNRRLFAKLYAGDYLRLRGKTMDSKGYLSPYGSYLSVEYVGGAYED